MSISKIKKQSLVADAIDATKIANDSISEEHLDVTAITGHTELSETANDSDVLLIYDTSAGALKKVLKSNVAQAGPTVSSVSPTNVNESASGDITFTITGTGFTAGSNARLIGVSGQVLSFDTVVRDSTTQITATKAASSFSASQDPYGVQVINGAGISSLLSGQINFNASPAFNTASGSLQTIVDGARTGVRIVIDADDPESAGNVTYELQSGSLPSGLSLSNEGVDGGIGVISGSASSVGSETTSNFVIRAVDAASNTSSRSFSITVQPPQSTSFTSSGTFAVPTGLTSADVLVVGGGGGGSSGGGGGGGLIFMPGYPLGGSGTITVTVGCGSAFNPTSNADASPGQDSSFGSPGDPGFSPTSEVLTAKGGGGGGANGGPGATGGSGGGAGRDDNSAPAPVANQPTQPGNSGAYGFGNAGGTQPQTSWTSAAGGGGANAAGGQGSGIGNPSIGDGGPGGNGGNGRSYTIADGTTPVTYAGGGGGGAIRNGGSAEGGNNGSGGGGAGGYRCIPSLPSGVSGQPGQANKGGGGGGYGNDAQPGIPKTAGSGGKGIVIVRY
jgi:hypothetical protein